MSRKAEPAYKTENNPFSKRLREIMEERHTTQKQLAETIKMRPQTVSLYMNGQSLPDVLTLKKIADFFDVSADWLLDREGAVKSINADLAAAVRYTNLSEDACKCLNRDGKQFFFRDVASLFITSDSMMDVAQGVALCKGHLVRGADIAATLSPPGKRQKDLPGSAIQRLRIEESAYKATRYEVTESVLKFIDEQTKKEKGDFDKRMKESKYDVWLGFFTFDENKNNELMEKLFRILQDEKNGGVQNGEHPETDN